MKIVPKYHTITHILHYYSHNYTGTYHVNVYTAKVLKRVYVDTQQAGYVRYIPAMIVRLRLSLHTLSPDLGDCVRGTMFGGLCSGDYVRGLCSGDYVWGKISVNQIRFVLIALCLFGGGILKMLTIAPCSI